MKFGTLTMLFMTMLIETFAARNECRRLGPEAFKHEIFANFVKQEIDLLKEVFFQCLESLKSIAEQNPRKDIENLNEVLPKVLSNLDSRGENAFIEAERTMIGSWDQFIEADPVTFDNGVLKHVKQIHASIHSAHMMLDSCFEDLGHISRILMMPIVTIVVGMIKQTPPSNRKSQTDEILKKLSTRHDLLGKVMGHHVQKELEDVKSKTPLPFYTFRVDDLISEFGLKLRTEMIQQEEKEKKVKSNVFWKTAFQHFASTNFHHLNQYCEDYDQLDVCEYDMKVEHLIRTMANLNELDDESLWLNKKLET